MLDFMDVDLMDEVIKGFDAVQDGLFMAIMTKVGRCQCQGGLVGRMGTDDMDMKLVSFVLIKQFYFCKRFSLSLPFGVIDILIGKFT